MKQKSQIQRFFSDW